MPGPDAASIGFRVDYRPGWDCHGLPIELKAVGADTGGLDPVEIRRRARRLALRTVQAQKMAFRSYGVMADWDNSWSTLDTSYQRRQLAVFRDLARGGWLVHKCRPVYWSPSSRTALAEAEITYDPNHVSRTAYVRFRLVTDDAAAASLFAGPLYVVVWTTTPWTLPANRAIAVRRDMDYSILRDDRTGDGLLFASSLLHVALQVNSRLRVVASIKGEALVGLGYLNPLRGSSSSSQPIIHADFVTETMGTGLVHLAPAHGEQDYFACDSLGIPAESVVDERGRFTAQAYPDDPERLTGAPSVIGNGGEAVLSLLGRDVLKVQDYTHTYPYDSRTWRPVIIMATKQWFLDVGRAKERALGALESVHFTPATSRNRLASFVATRDEWCISRQRVWGLPIPVAYDHSGRTSPSADMIDHLVSEVEKRGVDAWFSDPLDDSGWLPVGWEGGSRKTDTMDVWLDSGCNFALADRPVDRVADLCVEGTDQHRGWFQSSLLAYVMASSSSSSSAISGDADASFPAPYKALVTHGFVLAEDGTKMSKSLGNTISPTDIMEGRLLPPLKGDRGHDALGPDALRLWVASVDYTRDVVVGPAVLQTVHSVLLKLRVMLRILLGSMQPPGPEPAPLTKLDQIALVQLEDAFESVWALYGTLDFSRAFALLHRWVAQDLSAFYIEGLKDRLYCGGCGGGSSSGILDVVFSALLRMLAPLTPVLVQEAWDHRPAWMQPDQPTYLPPLHSAPLLDRDSRRLSTTTLDPAQIRAHLPVLRAVHDAVKTALEQCRARKLLASSLQSSITIHASDPALATVLALYADELDAIFVVSSLRLVNAAVPPSPHQDQAWVRLPLIVDARTVGSVAVFPPCAHKCVRCWRYVAPVDGEPCLRCAAVVRDMGVVVPEELN